jgi:hypothetical protein
MIINIACSKHCPPLEKTYRGTSQGTQIFSTEKIQMKFNNAVRFMHGEENDSNMFRYQNYFMALLQVINL